LGFRAKADKVNGHIELGLKGTDGGDIDVGTRRAYGVWKFSDMASLKVGKDYSPVSNLVSGQIFDSDAGLLGQGDFYGKRPAGLTLILGGFELAFLTNSAVDTSPNSIAASVANVGGVPTAVPAVASPFDITPTGADIDNNYPKIEARYAFKMGGFELIPFGGFQYFTVSSNNSILTDDLDIISYVGGLVAKVNLGAFYAAAEGAIGQNWANANWADGRSTGARGFISGFNAAGATRDGLDDTNDAQSWMAMGLVGLQFTPTLKFEAGFGYRNDDPDIAGLDDFEAWEAYLQAVVTLAPGVYIVPEVGYIDFMENDGDDLGYQWYAGAKWQIDF
jgi:hypothetical protein